MNAQQLRNSILQEAIEGRLVPQDPNDEPASALLQRIREEKKRLVKEGKLKKKDLEEKPISEDEIPFEIPESWEWCRMKDIVSLITKGSSPSWQGIKYVDKGILFITSENVREGFLDLSSPKYLEKEFNDLQTRSILKKRDLLTNIVGASIGRTAEFNLDLDDCNINQAVAIIRLLNHSMNGYLLKVLNSPFIIVQMIGKVVETARPNISLSSIEKLIIPLPPLAEQQRIVAKIEEVLPKVEEYGKAQEALDKLNAELPEKLKKSILQEAIEGRLVPQDPNDEPASVLLDKIRKEKAQLVKEGKLKKKDLVETPISEDEKPFEIPESWVWVRLGTIISYQNGYAYNSSEMNKDKIGVPVIKSGNLMTLEVVLKPNNDYIEHPNEKMLASKIVKGDMLMCLSSQSDNPEPLGKTAIYEFDTFALLNQRVLKFRPYDDKLTRYLFYTINSFYFWYNVSHQSGGSAQANLKLNHVLDMLIPFPPLAEQHRIVAKIEELFAGIDKLKTK